MWSKKKEENETMGGGSSSFTRKELEDYQVN